MTNALRVLKPTLILLFGLFASSAAFAQTPTAPADPHQCGPGNHWDPNMGGGMCMPGPAMPLPPSDDPHHCGTGNHWDPTMGGGMCMPGPATPPPNDDPHHCGLGNHWDPTMGSGMCMPDAPTPPGPIDDPHHCGAGNHWDPTMGTGMCMPGAPTPPGRGTQIAFHLNQFLVAGDTTGPRGRFAAYAPDMWMLNVNQNLSAHNTLQVSFMGTADRWTVPRNGSPETFQTGEANNQGVPYLDAQHPHSSPIMGLTFSDILTLNSAGDHTLTFFFAPRGEATAGPDSFMHRPSSTGNPYAPLSHHLQDLFHISSTVAGARYTDGTNTFEASTFSGQEPRPESVNLDVHVPDSYAARYTRQVDPVVRIGASYARVYVNPAIPEAGEPAQSHADYVSANAATESTVGRGTLDTDTIWGMAYNETSQTSLNSFLTEFVYQLGKNNFFGRMEVVQRSSDQLEIKLSNPDGEIHWVKAVTLGYERQISSRNGINLFAGGSVTQNITPQAFRPAYGTAPMGLELHLRLNLMRSRTRRH